MPDNKCRLCGSIIHKSFVLRILNKYDVDFHCCEYCECLQTEPPYWLEEAYSQPPQPFDTGRVVRNQKLQVLVWYITKILKMKKSNLTALDWGGGDGLFTRMIRDIGINARHFDKYATNRYAVGFDDDGQEYDFITALEVYEHFEDPATEIDSIFTRNPSIHLVTTGIYTGQGSDWDYIWPSTGMHIFFFSPKSFQYIAEKYGYKVTLGNNFILFYNKPISRIQQRLLKGLFIEKYSRLTNAVFASRTSYGLARADQNLLKRLKN